MKAFLKFLSLLWVMLLLSCGPILVAPPEAPPEAVAETVKEYAGVYPGQTVWQGRVTMLKDVLIPAGAHLIIRPGTEITVFPAEGTKIDPEYLSSLTELLVRGQLTIEGTEAAPVRFVIAADKSNTETVADETADDIVWAGITLDRSAKSRIQFAHIERADVAILCIASSALIQGNRITDSRYAIIAQQQSRPKILDNHISGGEGGIYCWRGSMPYLKGNRLMGLDEEAIYADATSRPWLDHNYVSGNAIGVALYADDLPYDLIEVIDNQENLRRLGDQGQTVSQSGGQP
nr:right-handed parallel beta-helix repeat-containing protein [Desulfuromonadales bacterium]